MITTYAYVVGDILHYGHLLLYLQNAKALGDRLIVGVLTDEAAMEKKPLPTIPFLERIIMVNSLKCVDLVVAQDTYAPHDNVRHLGVDILVESTDHSDELLDQGKALMQSLGGRLVILPRSKQSSTKIKERIKDGNEN